jgi:hypothetical protein
LTTAKGVLAGSGCGPQGFVCVPADGGEGIYTTTVATLCKNDKLGCAKVTDRLTCIATAGCRWIDNFTPGVASFSGACFPEADCTGPSDCSPGSTCTHLWAAGLGYTESGDQKISADVCAFCSRTNGPCIADDDCCTGACGVSGTCP